MTTISRAVLTTGCSTGIGRATAAQMAKGGYSVYATARRAESIADLADQGCRVLPLDVRDEVNGSEAEATVIERTVAARRPRTRYVITAGAKVLLGLRRWLPDRAFDAFPRTQFPVPGKKGK